MFGTPLLLQRIETNAELMFQQEMVSSDRSQDSDFSTTNIPTEEEVSQKIVENEGDKLFEEVPEEIFNKDAAFVFRQHVLIDKNSILKTTTQKTNRNINNRTSLDHFFHKKEIVASKNETKYQLAERKKELKGLVVTNTTVVFLKKQETSITCFARKNWFNAEMPN